LSIRYKKLFAGLYYDLRYGKELEDKIMEEKKNERQRLELEKELRLKNHDETGEKQR
jgi:hypothetical protein